MRMEILKEKPTLLVSRLSKHGFGVVDSTAELVLVRCTRREKLIGENPLICTFDHLPPDTFLKDNKEYIKLGVLKDSYRTVQEDGYECCQWDHLYAVAIEFSENGGFSEKHEII